MKRIIYPCLILLVACSQPKQGGLIYYNDCESIKGWTTVTLSKEHAHSGVYSNKVDTIHPYGLVLRQTFKDISPEKISVINASMWVYITPGSKGELVLEIRNHEGTIIHWASKKFDTSTVVPNNWKLVSTKFVIKDSINKADNVVAVYPWSTGKSDLFADDVKIEFITNGSH